MGANQPAGPSPAFPRRATKRVAHTCTALFVVAVLIWGTFFSAEPSFPRHNDAMDAMLALAFAGAVLSWSGHVFSRTGERRPAGVCLGLAVCASLSAVVWMAVRWP